MRSSEHKENLTKLSTEELEMLYERQKNILKNKNIINHLPDKGKQLQDKLLNISKELELRRNIKEIEENMKILSINEHNSKVLKEKYVQHICSIEKSPKKERYKPFSTLVSSSKTTEKPTQLISLTESMTLLVKQAEKLPVEQAKKIIEGSEIKHNLHEEGTENRCNDPEEEEEVGAAAAAEEESESDLSDDKF